MSDDHGVPSSGALADFLRAHRTRLAPQLVGLAGGARRRTPGLRREEVAALAGISTTWYTWVEQGRALSISPPALARLARTLRLSAAERAYLFQLAGKRDPDAVALAGDVDTSGLDEIVASIATPAYVLDRSWTALAWNQPAGALFVGWLDRPAERNLLRFMFLDPAARRLVRDWPARARRLAAEFRLDSARYLDDADLRALTEELTHASEAFASAWDQHDVIGREGGLRAFDHPKRGLVCYQQTNFTLAHRPELKLVMLIPGDAAGASPLGIQERTS